MSIFFLIKNINVLDAAQLSLEDYWSKRRIQELVMGAASLRGEPEDLVNLQSWETSPCN